MADRNISPPPLPEAVSPKVSALAITSLVLGILGLFTCGIAAVFGLILGIIAIVKVQNSGGRLKGLGLAIAGTSVSGAFVLLLPIMFAMLLPALAAAHDKAREINCMNNEKQLALAVIMYSNAHENTLPPAATWCDAIKSYTGLENVFHCPAVDTSANSRCDYAFNAKLDGLKVSAVNPQTVLIFESDGGWNASGGPDSLVSRHINHRDSVVAFADGHVEIVSRSRLDSLRWDP
jgi:prepilin-type processing-associated H-X9-DG protein